MVRHMGRQHGVGGLCGDLKDGRHGLKLGPGGALSQHFHNGAAHAPKDKMTGVNINNLISNSILRH